MTFVAAAIVVCLLLLGADAQKLGAYNVDIKSTTVSGLSSGGYMAVQMHVAFSSTIKGAAVFAGGPYNCAQGQVGKATSECMTGSPLPSLSTSIATTNTRAGRGELDPVANLENSRVYLFSGTDDGTVRPPVMNVLNQYYQNFVKSSAGGRLVYKNNLKAAHTFPTNIRLNRNACTTAASPYISFCDYDGAGEAFQVMYDGMKPPATELNGQFIDFDQTEFLSGRSMGPKGWAYVPTACAAKQPCKLHVALHGCVQALANIGDQFVKLTGYNAWAEANNIIVLYPQVQSSSFSPQNPNACWDWWGYNSNPTTYDTKNGLQMKAIYAMMERVSSGFVRVQPPTGLRVMNTTDNTASVAWLNVPEATRYAVSRNGMRVGHTLGFSYTDVGLASGSQYTYTVSSMLGESESAPSTPVTATTTGNPPPLGPPINLEVTGATSTTISLRWHGPEAAQGYNVFRNGVKVTPSIIPTDSFTDTGLAPSTSYTYTITSVSGPIESKESDPIVGTTTSAWQCASFYSSNYEHVARGRATQRGGSCYAVGSEAPMGLYNTFVHHTLAETASRYFVLGECPSNVV